MWIVLALLGSITAAIAITLTKAGLKNVNPALAFALQSIVIITISWVFVLMEKTTDEIKEIDKRGWLFLAGAGIATCLSSIFTFKALKLGDAAAVTSLERISLVFAVAFAVIFLKEKLNWQLVVGGCLMLGGAFLIAISKQNP